MHQLIKRVSKKLHITLVFTLAITTTFFHGANYAMASNTATQQASTSTATTITIVGKSADSAITTITFPQGTPGATISNPYNDVDTASDAQVLHASASEPVVRLKNTAGVTYNVTLEITTWNATYNIAASEGYNLVDTSTTNIASITDNNLSANGDANSVSTGVSMTTGTYKALYLELILGTAAGRSGSSTLTILGETP